MALRQRVSPRGWLSRALTLHPHRLAPLSSQPDQPIPRVKIYPRTRSPPAMAKATAQVQVNPPVPTLPPSPPSDRPPLFGRPDDGRQVNERNRKTANVAFAFIFASLLGAYAYEKSAEYELFGPADKDSYRARIKAIKSERSLQRREEYEALLERQQQRKDAQQLADAEKETGDGLAGLDKGP